jgi:hypothetical protein
MTPVEEAATLNRRAPPSPHDRRSTSLSASSRKSRLSAAKGGCPGSIPRHSNPTEWVPALASLRSDFGRNDAGLRHAATPSTGPPLRVIPERAWREAAGAYPGSSPRHSNPTEWVPALASLRSDFGRNDAGLRHATTPSTAPLSASSRNGHGAKRQARIRDPVRDRADQTKSAQSKPPPPASLRPNDVRS